MNKKIIGFDVMGNDHGVKSGVEAAQQFVANNPNMFIKLIGNENDIRPFLTKSNNIEVIHTEQTIDKTKGIREARQNNSSMSIALNMLKNKEIEAVISSGDSGIYLSSATLIVKRIKNIKRPAFMPIFPTIKKDKKFLMLDVGANLDSSSEMLVQWAKMASIFSMNVLNVKNPRVAILNVGTEKNKGREFHQEAYAKLEKQANINFQGFIEARNLLGGEVDVVVTDGYAGNMVLKTMEGTVLSLLSSIKAAIKSKTIYLLGGLLAKGAFKKVKKNLDYRNVGAAWILGINGIAIKCHGGADAQSYLGALNQVKIALNSDVITKIQEGFHG